MKITHAQIQMQSQHVYQHKQSKEESLKTWIGDERPRFEDGPATTAGEPTGGGGDRLRLSETAMRHYLQKAARQEAQVQPAAPINNGEDPKLTAMRLILEALTGKKIYIPSLEGYGQGADPAAVSQSSAEAPGQGVPAKAGWGLEYDYHEVNAEHEEMAFQAQGQVWTEDGLSLDVHLEMAMRRDFVETRDLQLRAGDAVLVDPLVINFADQPPSLTEQKFAFDLNSDGADEQISFVSPGSGFLFLDRNNDGQATDGSELFGPQHGSGFAELAALDTDANGWLDDNDPMFAKLQVWVKGFAQSSLDGGYVQSSLDGGYVQSSLDGGAVGSDYFASLKDLHIGAILLSHQASTFSLNNQQNTQLGQITDSGLFLREDGSAGAIQEIKLAV